jgi:tripartite-type tricarboxylate transporter receptor subunit TctC
MNRILIISLCFSAFITNQTFAAESGSATGQSQFPTKPIRFIVPFPPGGSDTIARIVAHKLTVNFGQQIIVDNRAGAGGMIGTEIATRATPDGYTILFCTASLPIGVNLYKKPAIDPIKDFTPVTLVSSGPMLLAVHPGVPAQTTMELVKLARSKPGALNFASTGTGSITHLAAEIFKGMTNISMNHVPYKGTGPAINDLLGKQVQLVFVPLGAGLPYLQSARLKGLGVGSLKRSAIAPDLPTISESGVPGYEASTWYGVLAPAGTPPQIVRILNTEIVKVLAQADTVAQITALGFDVTPSTPDDFRRYLTSELSKWGKVIRDTGLAKN